MASAVTHVIVLFCLGTRGGVVRRWPRLAWVLMRCFGYVFKVTKADVKSPFCSVFLGDYYSPQDSSLASNSPMNSARLGSLQFCNLGMKRPTPRRLAGVVAQHVWGFNQVRTEPLEFSGLPNSDLEPSSPKVLP